MSFTYNADGIRTSKSYYDEVTEYILDGSRIIAEIKGSDIFVYIYDELGLPIGIKYRTSNTSSYEYFFFEKNLQGDIVAIYNDSGIKIASYTYDAWGNFTKSQTSGVTYSTADSYVYNNNPFTYRGYYYDIETGLYYLQTRYYDPQIGRFISADGYVSTGQGFTGYNMYAYCNNSPIVFADFFGEDAIYIANSKDLPVFCHAGLLIQDDNGIWYYTDYGMGAADNVEFKQLENIYQSDPYKYLDDQYSHQEQKYISLLFGLIKIPIGTIIVRDYIAMYIPGDFSEAVSRAEKYKNSGFGPYNLVAHNCLHYAQELLKSGTCYDWAMQESISTANGFIPVTYIYDVMRGYNYAKQRIRGRLLGW